MQEAFLRAHRALRDDDRPVELKPWLHRIVRNLCIDELRRDARRRRRSRTATAPAPARTSTRRSAAATSCARLIDDLADLPEQQRAALLMRELDGLSHERGGRACSRSRPQASRQLVKRARTGLVAAAEARDADCAAIRDDLLTAHDEKRRPVRARAAPRQAAARRAREFRDDLKATRTPPARAGAADRLRPARPACCPRSAAAAAAASKLVAARLLRRARRGRRRRAWVRRASARRSAARAPGHRGRRQGARSASRSAPGTEAAAERRDRDR